MKIRRRITNPEKATPRTVSLTRWRLKRDSTDYVYTCRTFHKEIKKVLNLHGRIIHYTTSQKNCGCEIHNFSSSYYSSGRCSKNAASYVSRYIKLRHCGIKSPFLVYFEQHSKNTTTTRDFVSLGLWEQRLLAISWLFIKNVLQRKSFM